MIQLRHVIFVGLCVVRSAQIGYYYSILSGVVASHFASDGTPDRWMSKASFNGLEIGIFVLVLVIYTCLPWLVTRMSPSSIGLRNQEDVPSPERQTFAPRVFQTYAQWFCIAVLVFLIGVSQLVYRANIAGANLDSTILVLLGAFLVFVVIWLAKLVFALKKIR